MACALFYGYHIGMGYKEYNENPCGKYTSDCTVRALSVLCDDEWDSVYLQLCFIGLTLCEMPSQKVVVNQFLKERGYKRYMVPNDRPSRYSVRMFAKEHPYGKYLLATDSHVVPVISGDYIDNWDSGFEKPIFYWMKGEYDAI